MLVGIVNNNNNNKHKHKHPRRSFVRPLLKSSGTNCWRHRHMISPVPKNWKVARVAIRHMEPWDPMDIELGESILLNDLNEDPRS